MDKMIMLSVRNLLYIIMHEQHNHHYNLNYHMVEQLHNQLIVVHLNLYQLIDDVVGFDMINEQL